MPADLWPYPAYRDSGVKWMGRVPEHWEVRRLGATTERIVAGTWGSDPTGGDDIVCVRVADFDRHRLAVDLRKPTLRSVPVGERQGRQLEPGDLLLEKSGGGDLQPVGTVVHFDHDQQAVASNFIGRMRVRAQNSSRYVLYLNSVLYAIRLTVRSIKQTTGIQNLDVAAYLGEPIPFPPLSEQNAIASFLDHVDARIRRYIRAKEELIELLEEQKQAIIHQAVTGQIDVRTGQPYPAYKDSGVEWMREVPEHWEVRRLKALCDMQSGDTITAMSIEESGEYPVYGGNGLRGYTSTYTHDGDFALVGRQGALCGNIHLAHGRFWASEHAVVATLRRGHVLDWFGVLLRVMDLNQYSIAAAQPGLSVDRVMNLWVPVPPNREQRWIAERLVERSSELQGAVVATGRQTALLHEYRTRLIADVVTGKRDVREAAARLPETDPLAGESDRADAIPTESDLHSTAHYMAKEASA